MQRFTRLMMMVPLFCATLILQWGLNVATGCPFCGAVSATFTEEIELSDMAVFASLKSCPPAADPITVRQGDAPVPRATFKVDRVLKGDKLVLLNQELTAIYFGEAPLGTKFLLYGTGTPKPEWSTPIELNPTLEKYLLKVAEFPSDRGERAVLVQPYLLSPDSTVRQDAYNEFAVTEYADLRRVAAKFDAKQVREQLQKLDSEETQLALNYTLLGIIGGPDDIPMLEARLTATDDLQRKRLDALIGCYLTLKGAAGLDLIEREFVIKDLKAQNFSRLYRVLLALRFHGDDGLVIKKQQIAPILRRFLEYPKYADLVIQDLARWEDWSVMPRIMELFKIQDKEVLFVREPAVRFMRICPEPAAKEYLKEMEQLDPDAFKRAMLFPVALPQGSNKSNQSESEKKAVPAPAGDKS